MQGRFRTFTAAVMAALVSGVCAASAGAQAKQDPIMNSTQPVASNVYFQQTAAQVQAIEQGGEQLVDLEPDGTDAAGDTLYTVATVIPGGSAWQGFNFSSNPFPAGSDSGLVSNGSPRPFDMENHSRNSSGDPAAEPTFRPAYLGVANTGPFKRTWSLVRRRTATFLKKHAIDKGLRIIDLDPTRPTITSRFDVVLIKNSGSVARKWWFYVGVKTGFINDKVKEHKATITDLEPLADGTYAVVLERSSLRPYYRVNRTAAQIVSFAQEKNDRIADINPEPDAPGKYSAVFIPNG